MGQTKITIKVKSALLDLFTSRCEQVFIKRDAFLNHVLKKEIPHLASDMEGKHLSPLARRYISSTLKNLGTTQINVVVDTSTADDLNAIVQSSNMVRDAFMNRLIVFLVGVDRLLRILDLPLTTRDPDLNVILDPMLTSPLPALAMVYSDPLQYLRAACRDRHQTGIYLLDFPPQMPEFSCYLDDSCVPGSSASKRIRKQADQAEQELLALLNQIPDSLN